MKIINCCVAGARAVVRSVQEFVPTDKTAATDRVSTHPTSGMSGEWFCGPPIAVDGFLL
jgi:hypothetical protein